MRFRVLISACAGAALLAFAPLAPAAPLTGCAATVLREWRTGSISLRHDPACYRTALANLPEDMRIYSSAQDDIQRALQAQLTALAADHTRGRVLAADTQKATRTKSEQAALGAIRTSAAEDTLPIPVLIAGAAAILLVGLASASRVARKLRR